AGGGQHQDPRRRLHGGQLSADLVSVDEWEVAIEDDDVVDGEACVRERRLPVVSLVDRHPLATKPAPQGRSEMALVLGDKDANHLIPPADTRPGPGSRWKGVLTLRR